MKELEDKNIFMMCHILNRQALRTLPKGYHIRTCRKEELPIWKAIHFDSPQDAKEYAPFMDEFFERVYGAKKEAFFERVLFVCNEEDQPIATGFLWIAYEAFTTLHWLKVIKAYEGKGIGRALLSILLKDLSAAAFPVYLHTQPGSYRAIKLYSDFGFYLLSDAQIGTRKNELEEGLPYLRQMMSLKDFEQLRICEAPAYFLERLALFDWEEF